MSPVLVAGGAGAVAALVLIGLFAGGDLASPSVFVVGGLTAFLVVGTAALVVIWLMEMGSGRHWGHRKGSASNLPGWPLDPPVLAEIGALIP